MKVLLFALVFYMNPGTRSVTLLWAETVEHDSVEQCKAEGEKYKYQIETSEFIEVQYFCKKKVDTI